MEKKKCDPVRRGMGAQSDFITEPFVPSETYKAQQMTIAKELVAAGLNPEDVASMFFIPVDLLAEDKPKDEKANDL